MVNLENVRINLSEKLKEIRKIQTQELVKKICLKEA